jgi:hypothetical protein
MADPDIQALRAGPELISGAAIPFRFEITWRSLTRSLEPSGPASLERIPVQPARRPPARDAEAKEWEMVLPRMKRRVVMEAVSAEALEGRPVAPPSFGLGEAGGGSRNRWMAIGGVSLLILSGIAAFRWSGQTSSPGNETAASTMEMGSAGWVTEWASDRLGSARGRQISLYRPSAGMSDYRLEFQGRIERKSLGWVFRAADSRNYYVGKLEALRPGTSPLAITRFPVIAGVEGPHVQRVLAHSPGDMLRVKLEARGSRFTIYVQNQVVEDWQDDRLKAGSVGFLNEREERGKVESIQISFLRGGVH